MNPLSSHDYHPSHPWYYVRGGKPLRLKTIRDNALKNHHAGFISDDIAKTARLCEPKRSTMLKNFKQNILRDLQGDIALYRQLRRLYTLECSKHHPQIPPALPICQNIHVSLSLKYAHLSNHFAHLHQLKKYAITEQYSLF